ncbi:carboxypeptidase-like regulatory domain-containing protein [Flavitalea sp.]|nr:TonB-dependent receptor [Flavitalea sp.]
MKRAAVLILIICFHLFAFSQDRGIYKGQITSNNVPVPGATVALLKQADSALVKLSVSNNEGVFEFPDIIKSNYLLLITSVGFDSLYTIASENVNIQIQLKAKAQALGSVTILAKRPLVEARLDKMIVNVDASPSNAGATALELLEKSPGISVDKDGNISLKGKQGVIVLMDGKQTYLSGQDLANMLRSMPASQLDQLEIITQPSAKYDAAGNAGILNLKTKKAKTMGFNGSVNVGYVQGNYPKSPNSFNFNYREGKINLFTSGGYHTGKVTRSRRLRESFNKAQTIMFLTR